jgi:plastocyanin
MKKKYIIILVLVIVAAVFFVGKSKKSEAPTVPESTVSNTMPVPGSNVEEMVVNGVKEFTITGKNFSFMPNLIKVKKGDRVRITFNNTEGFHDFVIDEFGAATKQAKSPDTEVLEFVADKTGSFEFYCSVGSHRAMGMKGTLVVE